MWIHGLMHNLGHEAATVTTGFKVSHLLSTVFFSISKVLAVLSWDSRDVSHDTCQDACRISTFSGVHRSFSVTVLRKSKSRISGTALSKWTSRSDGVYSILPLS